MRSDTGAMGLFFDEAPTLPVVRRAFLRRGVKSTNA